MVTQGRGTSVLQSTQGDLRHSHSPLTLSALFYSHRRKEGHPSSTHHSCGPVSHNVTEQSMVFALLGGFGPVMLIP